METNIISFKILDSTNNKAMELAEAGARHGTVIHAEQQTAGKGRLDRKWISVPNKGVFVTFIIRPDLEIEDFSKLTLTAGVAITKCFEKFYSLSLQLKWPNDIYFGGKKLGGILTQAGDLLADDPFVVIGVGLNVDQSEDDFSGELKEKATSLRLISDNKFIKTELIEKLTKCIYEEISMVINVGFAACFDSWKKRDMLFGKKIELVSKENQKINGLAIGINSDGILLIQDENGVKHEVMSGDLSILDI